MTSVEGKNVFLSGPMTGLQDWNRKAFMRADKSVEMFGAAYIYNPAEHIEELEGFSHGMCMRVSLQRLCSICHGNPFIYGVLVSLPGWENSSGACLERTVAKACGMEVCNIEDVIA